MESIVESTVMVVAVHGCGISVSRAVSICSGCLQQMGVGAVQDVCVMYVPSWLGCNLPVSACSCSQDELGTSFLAAPCMDRAGNLSLSTRLDILSSQAMRTAGT
jgi:hypothetical protein